MTTEFDDPFPATAIPPVRLLIRMDDLDTNGHVRGPAYLTYADHARWTALDAAGVDLAALVEQGLGPVSLETVVRYRRELTAPGEVEVRTAFEFGTGRTDRVRQELIGPDGVLSAEIRSVSGLLDLRTRTLVERPSRHLLALATRPELLGLS